MEHAVLVDDSRLVEALRAGDERVFEQVTREYHASLLLRVVRLDVNRVDCSSFATPLC